MIKMNSSEYNTNVYEKNQRSFCDKNGFARFRNKGLRTIASSRDHNQNDLTRIQCKGLRAEQSLHILQLEWTHTILKDRFTSHGEFKRFVINNSYILGTKVYNKKGRHFFTEISTHNFEWKSLRAALYIYKVYKQSRANLI